MLRIGPTGLVRVRVAISATARKDLPLNDVAAVGGWKDIQTLVNCYQQADDDTMLLVMSHPKKISERVPNG